MIAYVRAFSGSLVWIGMVAFFLMGCGSPTQANLENAKPENPLKGKWKLHKRKFDPDTVFLVNPDTIEYVKIITDGTFLWYNYDKESKIVINMAGGSYDLEGGSYTEYIEFFHPPGSFMEGSAIPFRCEVNGDEWLHAGYINDREFDEEIGDYVILNERRLEEIWKRVE